MTWLRGRSANWKAYWAASTEVNVHCQTSWSTTSWHSYSTQWPLTPQGWPSLPCPLPRPFPISQPCLSIKVTPNPDAPLPGSRWYSHTAASLACCFLPPRRLANMVLAWEQMIKWADVQQRLPKRSKKMIGPQVLEIMFCHFYFLIFYGDEAKKTSPRILSEK